MTLLDDRPAADAHAPEPAPSGLLAFLTTTDHKRIGIAYMVTAFAFFIIGGGLAEIIRAQLWTANHPLVSESTYNQVFTMHGSVMLFLFVGPFAFGLANYLVPIQIGARDMAFPRLNAFSYWCYLFGGLTMLSGFLTSTGAADFGWTGYSPMSEISHTPGVGVDLWVMALVLTGLSGVLTAVNVIATVVSLRAPGMRMFRMPIFTWNMTVTSLLVLVAFPILTAAAAMLFADRHLGAHVFDTAGGGQPAIWQHLFWFFGHPEVYIVVLPYFGVITDLIPVFSRRPIFGYPGLVLATFGIASLSVGVWAHHMFATGIVTSAYFSGLSMLIAIPTGVKFFNWIGTMWGGQISYATPMKFALGFMATFLFGGISGVFLASAPIDVSVHDSYFVVAHMHYVLFGGSVFALYAAVYYWFPKFTGRMLDARLGTIHFWMTLVGFHLTFFVQHILGVGGMPRRIASYAPLGNWQLLNRISSVGAFLLGASTLPFLWNIWRSWRHGSPAGDDPWDGHTLEWSTSSPPPAHNFDGELPPIMSNRPAWDLKHPDALEVAGHEA